MLLLGLTPEKEQDRRVLVPILRVVCVKGNELPLLVCTASKRPQQAIRASPGGVMREEGSNRQPLILVFFLIRNQRAEKVLLASQFPREGPDRPGMMREKKAGAEDYIDR